MGSRVYAKSCRDSHDNILAMVCLEMIGYYSTRPNSQEYPQELLPLLSRLLPSRGDFIAIVGDLSSRRALLAFTRGFKSAVIFPVVAHAIPRAQQLLWVSDHGPFWDEGYPAFMVTDTSWFRNPHDHHPSDLPDTLDYDRMARVTLGIAGGLRQLADPV